MYARTITRRHRTLVALVADLSGSMREEILFRGVRTTKADAVAEVVNGMLSELVLRATREGEVRDYYDIALWGYSGEGVLPLAGEGLLSVAALAARRPPLEECRIERRRPDGSPAIDRILRRRWIVPVATGRTPMYEALLTLRDLTARWCADPAHAESFPPLLFHITDGEASDCDEEELRAVAAQIRALSTADGNVLFFNIHIASAGDAPSVLFLTDGEARYANRYARLLSELSSELPSRFDEAVRSLRGPQVPPPYRAMAYNASPAELLSILNIGSISVNLC